MEQIADRSYRDVPLTLAWKIIIVLNVILDAPILLNSLTGYIWNNAKANIISPLALGTAIWLLVTVSFLSAYKESGYKLLIRFIFFLLFSVICWASMFLLAILSLEGLSLPENEISFLSPDKLRIADLTPIRDMPSYQYEYTLQVRYASLPFIAVPISNVNPDINNDPVKWLDNNTISVSELGNTTRIFQAKSVDFQWLGIGIFLFYLWIKYGYVIVIQKPFFRDLNTKQE